MNQKVSVVPVCVGELEANCYIVTDIKSQESVIIDPGDTGGYIAEKALLLGAPKEIILTHGHFDHMLGAFELQEIFQIPVRLHARDEFLRARMNETAKYYLKRDVIEPPPKIYAIADSHATIQLGDTTFEILETPGHTPGSVSIYNKDAHIVFSGDVVFADGRGDTTHAYSNSKDLNDSICLLRSMPPETRIYPGHGNSFTVSEMKKIFI